MYRCNTAMVKALSRAIVIASGVACLGILPASAADRGGMLRVSYLQMDALGSLSAITKSGYASSNMVNFAFADLREGAAPFSPAYLSAMQTAINAQASNTIYQLSVGGQYADAENINPSTVQKIIDQVSKQVAAYNQNLHGAQISGIDLDLENSIDATTITALAKGFKDKGFLVSVAPQVYYVGSNSEVDPGNPVNLGLTSGGPNNQYGPAIAAGYVDTIVAQTYNTGGWTVGGVQESSVDFFTNISHALNSAVRDDCANVTTLCIPKGVAIVVGTPSNASGSGTVNNIFGSNGSTPYDQQAVLGKLSSAVDTVLATYPNITGVMQWSLNNDYMPSAWADQYAVPGAFSATMFGAALPPPLPYFILQVSNSGPNLPGDYAYASATMVVNGQYWIFGNVATWAPAGMAPIAPLQNQLWGTLPSSRNPATPSVVDSANLDTIFGNGKTSFSTSQIVINGYPSNNTPIGSPTGQWNCPAGKDYVFEAGHSYNILVNPVFESCAIQKVN